MKTLVVSILLAIAYFTNQASAATIKNNETLNFAYNYEMNGSQIASKIVFKVESEKYLKQYLKYNYTYDADGRVLQKEVLKWNETSRNFEKQYCLNLNYAEKEVSIELVSWNAKQQTYSNVKEKAVYQLSDVDSSVNYTSYLWNEKESTWHLVAEQPIVNNDEKLLVNK